MDIRVLQYFLAVAREESISGAAEAMHVTQPTLSRQLMDLENELGCKLFIRGSRRVTLTDEGMLLRKRAEEITHLVDMTSAEFDMSGDVVNGDIYIGGGETDAMRFVARSAMKFREAHPRVTYRLFSGNADDVMDKLDKGLLDFAILIEPVNMRKYNFIRFPATDVWGVLMRKDCPLAARETVRPCDLYDLPLHCSERAIVKNELSGWLGRDLDQMDIVSTFNLSYNTSVFVSEGLGYAFTIDKKLIGSGEESTVCFRPLEPKMEVGLDIVWKKYKVFSKAAEKFLEYLQADLAAERNK